MVIIAVLSDCGPLESRYEELRHSENYPGQPP